MAAQAGCQREQAVLNAAASGVPHTRFDEMPDEGFCRWHPFQHAFAPQAQPMVIAADGCKAADLF
jgi:hypothetical protein